MELLDSDVFVDWRHADRKEIGVCVGPGGEPYGLGDFKKLLKLLGEGSRVFVETGCPARQLVHFKNRGAEIFLVDGWETKAVRGDSRVTDVEAAGIVREVVRNASPGNGIRLVDPDEEQLRLLEESRVYEVLTREKVRRKNALGSLKRHYPDPSGEHVALFAVDDIQRQLDLIERGWKERFGDEVGLVEDIRGLNTVGVARLLIEADPATFSSWKRWAVFFGLCNKEDIKHRYSRRAATILHQIAQNVIMARDPVFKALYDERKVEIAGELPPPPETSKMRVHMMAMNRMKTQLCRELWGRFHSRS